MTYGTYNRTLQICSVSLRVVDKTDSITSVAGREMGEANVAFDPHGNRVQNSTFVYCGAGNTCRFKRSCFVLPLHTIDGIVRGWIWGVIQSVIWYNISVWKGLL